MALNGITNLYFTDSRAITAVRNALGDTAANNITTDTLHEGITNLYFTNSRAISALGNITTDNLPQGDINKYFSDSSAISAIVNSTTLTLNPDTEHNILHAAGISSSNLTIGESGPSNLTIQHSGIGNINIKHSDSTSGDINMTTGSSTGNINMNAGGETGYINLNSSVQINNINGETGKFFYLNSGPTITTNSWRISVVGTGLFFDICTDLNTWVNVQNLTGP